MNKYKVFSKKKFLNFLNVFKVYTQVEQETIVNARNEAAAQKIAEIKRKTQEQLAKLVIDLKKF